MQTILPTMETVSAQDIDLILWARAALKECIAYHEHGVETEVINGKTMCFNCGGAL